MWVHVSKSGDADDDRDVINTHHIVRVQFIADWARVFFVDGNREDYHDAQSVSNLSDALKNTP